jgi:hypothetical protein
VSSGVFGDAGTRDGVWSVDGGARRPSSRWCVSHCFRCVCHLPSPITRHHKLGCQFGDCFSSISYLIPDAIPRHSWWRASLHLCTVIASTPLPKT